MVVGDTVCGLPLCLPTAGLTDPTERLSPAMDELAYPTVDFIALNFFPVGGLWSWPPPENSAPAPFRRQPHPVPSRGPRRAARRWAPAPSLAVPWSKGPWLLSPSLLHSAWHPAAPQPAPQRWPCHGGRLPGTMAETSQCRLLPSTSTKSPSPGFLTTPALASSL